MPSPEQVETDAAPAVTGQLTPRQIVAELDRYIIGQADAKRAVAIAVRNRWRRQQLAAELQPEIAPKNILMIGPTGVGKTEIARRLARLTGAPFIKVEATKYTEVGYYGRDVESMVRELVENAIGIVRERERKLVEAEAHRRAEQRLLDLLVAPPPEADDDSLDFGEDWSDEDEEESRKAERRHRRVRKRVKTLLDSGQLEDRRVEMRLEAKATPVMFGGVGLDHLDADMQSIMDRLLPKHTSRREMTVAEARQVLFEQEVDNLLDSEKINAAAIELAENQGIIFVDEIDKVVASDTRGADVSRQGVQRDLLPIVEGTTVQTRYGHVRTDHVLFVAAGAFHRVQPSDLMPELQGRFPIRVELQDLSQQDFVRILREPKNALTRQYVSLLATEGLTLQFTDDAVEKLAEYAFQVNQSTQNIGARRLATILERTLEELSFAAADNGTSSVTIDAAYVAERLQDVAQDQDLSKYIL